jgi:hypothetical protein
LQTGRRPGQARGLAPIAERLAGAGLAMMGASAMSDSEQFERPFEYDDRSTTTLYATDCLRAAASFYDTVRHFPLESADPAQSTRARAFGDYIGTGELAPTALHLILLRAGRRELLPPCQRIFSQVRRNGTILWMEKVFPNAHVAAVTAAEQFYVSIRSNACLQSDELRRLCAESMYPAMRQYNFHLRHKDINWLWARLATVVPLLQWMLPKSRPSYDLASEIEWEAIQAAQPQPPAAEGIRPPMPTHAYCLVPPSQIRWLGEKRVQPRLWHLLGLVLDRGDSSIPFEEITEVVHQGKAVIDKTICNEIYELNKHLLDIRFPWGVKAQDAHLVRKKEGP